jgi:hypothetical protein
MCYLGQYNAVINGDIGMNMNISIRPRLKQPRQNLSPGQLSDFWVQ